MNKTYCKVQSPYGILRAQIKGGNVVSANPPARLRVTRSGQRYSVQGRVFFEPDSPMPIFQIDAGQPEYGVQARQTKQMASAKPPKPSKAKGRHG